MVHWKKCAAEHECEELKDGAWAGIAEDSVAAAATIVNKTVTQSVAEDRSPKIAKHSAKAEVCLCWSFLVLRFQQRVAMQVTEAPICASGDRTVGDV